MDEDKAYYPFADDSPSSIYVELQTLEGRIIDTIREIKDVGTEAINRQARYERMKEGELITLFTEEADKDWGKPRTEAQRKAIYRTKFAAEKIAWQMADREYQILLTSLKALQAVLLSTQSRSKLMKQDFTG